MSGPGENIRSFLPPGSIGLCTSGFLKEMSGSSFSLLYLYSAKNKEFVSAIFYKIFLYLSLSPFIAKISLSPVFIPFSRIQLIQGLHFFFAQGKVEKVQIFPDIIQFINTGDDDISVLELPAEDDLGRRFAIFL